MATKLNFNLNSSQNWLVTRPHTCAGLGIGQPSGSVTSTSAASVSGPTSGVLIDEFMSGYWEAVTISGTITFNLWGLESAMTTNAGFDVAIYRLNCMGEVISLIARSESGSELGTSSAVRNWTTTPTSTTLAIGDRLLVQVYANDAGGNMASGGTITLRWNGPTASADGDSWIQFNETLVATGDGYTGGSLNTFYSRRDFSPAFLEPAALTHKLSKTALAEYRYCRTNTVTGPTTGLQLTKNNAEWQDSPNNFGTNDVLDIGSSGFRLVAVGGDSSPIIRVWDQDADGWTTPTSVTVFNGPVRAVLGISGSGTWNAAGTIGGVTGRIARTTNAVGTWAAATTQPTFTDHVGSFAANDTTRIVAACKSGQFAYSTDVGVNWTTVAAPSGWSPTSEPGIGFGNSIFVAGGASGTIIYSSDGSSWSDGVDAPSAVGNIRRVVYADGIWMVGGSTGIATTDNPVSGSWTVCDTSGSTLGATPNVTGLAWGNDVWIATDSAMHACASDDNGVTWRTIDSASGWSGGSLYGAAFAADDFVVVGTNGTIGDAGGTLDSGQPIVFITPPLNTFTLPAECKLRFNPGAYVGLYPEAAGGPPGDPATNVNYYRLKLERLNKNGVSQETLLDGTSRQFISDAMSNFMFTVLHSSYTFSSGDRIKATLYLDDLSFVDDMVAGTQFAFAVGELSFGFWTPTAGLTITEQAETQVVTLGLITSASALYAPVLSEGGGPTAVELGLLDGVSAIYAPTVRATNTLVLGLLDGNGAIYAPSLEPGISLGLLDAGGAIYAPSLGLTVQLVLLDGGSAIYTPVVAHAGGAQAAELGLLESTNAIYAPTIAWYNSLTLVLLDGGSAIYAPVVAGASVLVTLGLIQSTSALYGPSLANVSPNDTSVYTPSDGRYTGQAQAIHTINNSFSIAEPREVAATDTPIYTGGAAKIGTNPGSPAQWNSPSITGPVWDTPVYRGVSEAIHVFGDDTYEWPPIDPIDSCNCCEDTPNGIYYPLGFYDYFTGRSNTGNWGQLPSGAPLYWRPNWAPEVVWISGDKGYLGPSFHQGISVSPTGTPSDFAIYTDGPRNHVKYFGLSFNNLLSGKHPWAYVAIMRNETYTYWYQLTVWLTTGTLYVDKFNGSGDWLGSEGSIAFSGGNLDVIVDFDSVILNGSLISLSESMTRIRWELDIFAWNTDDGFHGIGQETFQSNTTTLSVEGVENYLTVDCLNCLETCEDPENPGNPPPPFTPGYMPIFRRQIGDPTTTLDSYICTMESGAMVLDWHTRGAVQVWGGELIPWSGRTEESIYGNGTNLGDVQQAWRHWGEYLDIRSGQSWNDLIRCLNEGRAVILQGDYGEFSLAERCQDDFVDNHAISVYPYRVGASLLVGDPICHIFRGIPESSLQAYAEALGVAVYGSTNPQKILFAVSRPWTP